MHIIRDLGIFLKETLKRVLGFDTYRRYYLLYRRISGTYYILTSDLNRVLLRRVLGGKARLRQENLIWRTSVPTWLNSDELKSFLGRNGIRYHEGAFAIYVPPQLSLAEHFGDMVSFYPADAGYKILKDFAPPHMANYTKDGVTVSWSEAKLVGNPSDQLDAACVTGMLGLTSRVYDLVELEIGQTKATCFVVQHVDGQPLTAEDCAQFIGNLDQAVQAGIIQTAVPYKGSNHIDFLPPDCNGNLVKHVSGELFYVDFQQFVVLDQMAFVHKKLLTPQASTLSFGDVHPLRKNEPYLYQSIPGVKLAGRRDSITRWGAIQQLLSEAGITVTGRMVLDVCCNSGVMSSMALSKGALWSLGWDLPEVAEIGLQLQRALGFSRIDITGTSLTKDYVLSADIPPRLRPFLDEAIVLYLAVWNHIGFISEIASLPWRALVFEGHERIKLEEYQDVIDTIERECRCRLAASTVLRDGDSPDRQLLVFVR